jgi:site-specific DNA-methyltransferase (adenine-specific)
VESLALGFAAHRTRHGLLLLGDCMEWLRRIPEGSLHAVVTDPPYGVKEFEPGQLERLRAGRGGIWRIPPSFDGHTRAPLPRFTALSPAERARIAEFITEWSSLVLRAMRPGAHVFLAGNAFLAPLVWGAVVAGGLEYRGQLIRLVRTLRGGDRPKNAHHEFPDVCSLPRGSYEPWGIFRAPLPDGMRVADCLRIYETGGLRRRADGPPADVIRSQRTSRAERALAPHPSLKPQSFLRQVVHAVLPLGRGIIADPFMGSGSTVAAADAIGASCVGVERDERYFEIARRAVPKLALLESSL